jgi:hypothetical protein
LALVVVVAVVLAELEGELCAKQMLVTLQLMTKAISFFMTRELEEFSTD